MNKEKKRRKTDKRTPNIDSRQPSVFSYHSKRSVEARADMSVKARLYNWWKRLPTVIGVIVVIFSLLYMFSLETQPSITLVSNTDGSRALLREPKVYEEKASEVMGESLFYGNKLTFAHGKFENKMLEEFPEFSSVSVTTGLFSRHPRVTAIVRTPAFYMEDIQGQVYLIDISGEVSLPVSDTAAELRRKLPRVTDLGSENLSPGETALTKAETQFISALAALLEKAEQDINSITLTTNAHELHLHLEDKNYYVKFNTLEDVRLQLGTLLATQQHLRGSSETPGSYIDVRVEGRVFYN